MKRLAANEWIAKKYEIDVAKLEDSEYSRLKFGKLFNFRYKTQTSFDWAMGLLSDGRGIVTPRDLIDLIGSALLIHARWLQEHTFESSLCSVKSIQAAHQQLSRRRYTVAVTNEFSHLTRSINKLRGRKDKHSGEELRHLFGAESDTILSELVGIGILRFDSKKDVYRVARLYSPGLSVFKTRQRRL